MIDQPLPSRHRRPLGVYGLLLLLLTVAAGGMGPAPASAAGAARVIVAPAVADPDYATTLQLTGSGFQSVKNGFGGIYVFFGWVDKTWRPSQGGESGVDYVYVQDSEAKDNRGFQRFVSYPGDPTASSANGGQVAADGSWATSLIVPKATFPARGRSGAIEQIDCRKVQCGIITIGGHGVVNATNETFTPISFTGATAPAAATTAPAVTPPPASAAAASPVAAATSSPAAAPSAVDVSAEPVASVRTSTSVSVSTIAIGMAIVLAAAGAVVLVLRRRRAGRSEA